MVAADAGQPNRRDGVDEPAITENEPAEDPETPRAVRPTALFAAFNDLSYDQARELRRSP